MVYKIAACRSQCNDVVPRAQEKYHLLKRLNQTVDEKTVGTRWLPRFLQNTNRDAKYYGNKKKTLKKDKVTYLQVSEYFSVVPEITNSGLMDGKY